MAAGVQLVGTIVGTALGGPVGGALGSFAGGLLGAALFPPPTIRGPRAEDIRFNNSNVGAPIKRLYGSGRTAPTLMWFGEREDVERTRKEGGVFGVGGQKITEYEYYLTCAFALGEPADAAGVDIRRIWANGELIYSQNELSAAQLEQLEQYLHLQQFGLEQGLFGNSDPSGFIASSAAAQKFEDEVLTIYRGTEDQDADPTIQSYVGAEDTPAYKGLAYFVLRRFDITKWGGAMPNIEVEYVNGPSNSISAPEYRNQALYPWNLTGTQPESCSTMQYRAWADSGAGSFGNISSGAQRATFAEALADVQAQVGTEMQGPYATISGAFSSVRSPFMRPDGAGTVDDELQYMAAVVAPYEIDEVADPFPNSIASYAQAVTYLLDTLEDEVRYLVHWLREDGAGPGSGTGFTDESILLVRRSVQAAGGGWVEAASRDEHYTVDIFGSDFTRFSDYVARVDEVEATVYLTYEQALDAVFNLNGSYTKDSNGQSYTITHQGNGDVDAEGEFPEPPYFWDWVINQNVPVYLLKMNVQSIRVERLPGCPPSECEACDRDTVPLPEDTAYCVDAETGAIYSTEAYTRYDTGSTFRILTTYTALDPYPSGYYEEPAFPSTDARYDDEENWTRLLRDAGARGVLPDGWESWVYGVDYPVTVVSPDWRVLQQYAVSGDDVSRYPLGPCVPEWSRQYNDPAFWDDAYSAQRARYDASGLTQDFIPDGLSFGAGYPVTQTWGCARFPQDIKQKQALPITVRSVVEDISDECGLTPAQIDASALTKTLWGYERNAVMTGRDAIEQLRTYAFFDACESGTQIRFVPRGGAVVATLTADDLGAHVDGEQPPPAITPSRVNDVELPRKVLINYLDVASKYQGNTQQAGRVVVGEQNTLNLSLAIVAEAATMKGVANAVLYDQWAGRNSYDTALLREWLRLEPTDPIVIPVDSQDVRMRITQIDHDPRGVLKLKAVREEATAFDPAADDDGVAFPAPDETQPYNGPTLLTVIDGPALDEGSDDAGVFLAARGLSTGWAGALVYASTDDSSYDAAVSIGTAAQMGLTDGALAAGPHHLWDRSSTLTVVVDDAISLLSVTELEVLNGANRAFVGAAGRWELVAFVTATLTGTANGKRTYALTDLLRGLQGTEWAVGLHEDGDTFAMAASVSRLALPVDRIGLPLYLKAVTAGTSIDNTTAVQIMPAGVALEPYAPCQIRGTREVDGDIAIEWKRRTRISGEWRDSVDVPLNEDVEAYEVDILNSAGTVLRTLTSSTGGVTYTQAQISEDFAITPDAIAVRVYQLSADVGRGYAGSGTV